MADDWFWCLHHRRAERGADVCPPHDLMGPYPSAEDARKWRDRLQARNEKWEAEDRGWSGEDDT
ncbi:MAG TPA: hypothetical protein VMZ51_06505 [Acidimicrobiales bacterium]|nr:hypothetical protein [Acidimicrobiales bacterium]